MVARLRQINNMGLTQITPFRWYYGQYEKESIK